MIQLKKNLVLSVVPVDVDLCTLSDVTHAVASWATFPAMCILKLFAYVDIMAVDCDPLVFINDPMFCSSADCSTVRQFIVLRTGIDPSDVQSIGPKVTTVSPCRKSIWSCRWRS